MEKAKGKKLFYRPAGKRKGMYTPTQIICVSFVIVIALGTFLLSLPVASKHGRLDVLDAMFTATSATCAVSYTHLRAHETRVYKRQLPALLV